MTAYPFQFATLVGCVILLPLIGVAYRARLMVWQLALLLAIIPAMYIAFYVWLFWFAPLPHEYAWLSAAIRSAEIALAIGAMLAIICAGWDRVKDSWKTS